MEGWCISGRFKSNRNQELKYFKEGSNGESGELRPGICSWNTKISCMGASLDCRGEFFTLRVVFTRVADMCQHYLVCHSSCIFARLPVLTAQPGLFAKGKALGKSGVLWALRQRPDASGRSDRYNKVGGCRAGEN